MQKYPSSGELHKCITNIFTGSRYLSSQKAAVDDEGVAAAINVVRSLLNKKLWCKVVPLETKYGK